MAIRARARPREPSKNPLLRPLYRWGYLCQALLISEACCNASPRAAVPALHPMLPKRGKNKGIHQDSYRSSRWVGWVFLVLDHTRGHLRIPTMIIYSEQRIFLTGIQNFRNLDPVISMTCKNPPPTSSNPPPSWLERGGCKCVEVGRDLGPVGTTWVQAS